MTDTFFDLQRFAPVLVGGTSSFTWQDGETFGGASAANLGTSSNPAYYVATGGLSTSAGTGTEIYLNGQDKTPFSIGKDWTIALGSDNVLQVTNGGTSLALGTQTGMDAAVLTINGEYNEAMNGTEIYFNTAAATNVSYGPLGYTVADGASDFLVGLNEKAGSVYLGNNNSNVSIAAGTDTASASAIGGFSFEKGASAFNSNGNIEFWTNSNKITLPGSDVLDLKVTDSLLTGPAVITANAITGATGGATLTTSTGVKDVTFNDTTWNEITGSLSSIAFDSVGAATVNNSGAVTVDGAKGAKVTIANLDTVGAEVNGLKVSAEEAAEVSFTLETVEIAGVTVGGISAIDVSKALGKDVLIDGGSDGDFDVVAGSAKYNVTATIADNDYILFNATASRIELFPSLVGSNYAVTGGDAKFTFEAIENFATGKSANSTLNGAVISYTLGSTFNVGDQVNVYAKEEDAGISTINHARAGDKFSVASDADGFTVNFDSVSGNGTFEVNGASINAAGITGQSATLEFGAAGGNVTVKGLNSTDDVSVAGGTTGMTYHFNNGETSNAVKVAAGETMYVTLDSAGNVEDFIDEDDYKKLQADENKWNNIATIGSSSDSILADHAAVYDDVFYALGSASAGTVSLATFDNEDSTSFDTVSNPTGIEIRGDKILSEAGHITLTAGSSVGAAPINIQSNESEKVVDVVLDLRGAGAPSTVAVGTLGEVSAAHEVSLSNKGVGYAYFGSGATGQNRIFAGTAGAQIRNDGSRATIVGNSGNDTIWAGASDIVKGGAGADYFYDTANYTVQDYDATQGDAIIATRVNSVDDITKDNVRSDANRVGFGTGNKMLTIGDDQNASLNLKVAVMNTNADVVGTPRNVALAGSNGGALDASGLEAAALILADYDRNENSGDNVIGSAYNDSIYVGANDSVNGGTGNDYITIDSLSSGAGVTVELSAGKDTISGWRFGFDKNSGATELIADEGYVGSFENDRLMVTAGNKSILFEGTGKAIEQNHGEAQVLINGEKWMAIRTNDENRDYISYGDVESNSEIADTYIAEREGVLEFGASVTADLGIIELNGEQNYDNSYAKYQNITDLRLANNSKASVFGTSGRETVSLGGDADAGANKKVSLGAGNDVIISGGDSSVTAGHMFYFGANDGLDTIRGFSHYLGIEQDPDKQYADTIVLEKYGSIYTGTGENGGSRIDFTTEGDSRISLFESEGINVENLYQIKVGQFDTKLAKIGNSSGSNVFTYESDVDYYVGSSADNARDTLNVGNEIANANIWLDGTNGTYDTNADEQYYRGIAVVNASAETNTNVALAGNGNDNTLYGGGAGTNNSLWGGAGNNVLIGSTEGQDVFFYVRNAGYYLQGVDDSVTGGNDTVQNYNLDNGDIVWLGDTTVDDILNTEVTDNSVVVNFKNGGSLTVEGSDDVRFLINSGTESWVTDKDNSENHFKQES